MTLMHTKPHTFVYPGEPQHVAGHTLLNEAPQGHLDM